MRRLPATLLFTFLAVVLAFSNPVEAKPNQFENLFVSPQEQIENIRRWNDQRDWGFSDREIDRLKIPSFQMGNSLVVPILVPYLSEKDGMSGFKRTFKELWEITVSHHTMVVIGPYDQDMTDVLSQLELKPGIKHKDGLRWELIDLGANKMKAPKPHKGYAPHAAILAAAAHFPNWVKNIDRHFGTVSEDKVPPVCLPGYRWRRPFKHHLPLTILYLSYSSTDRSRDRQTKLYLGFRNPEWYPDMAVPEGHEW